MRFQGLAKSQSRQFERFLFHLVVVLEKFCPPVRLPPQTLVSVLVLSVFYIGQYNHSEWAKFSNREEKLAEYSLMNKSKLLQNQNGANSQQLHVALYGSGRRGKSLILCGQGLYYGQMRGGYYILTQNTCSAKLPDSALAYRLVSEQFYAQGSYSYTAGALLLDSLEKCTFEALLWDTPAVGYTLGVRQDTALMYGLQPLKTGTFPVFFNVSDRYGLSEEIIEGQADISAPHKNDMYFQLAKQHLSVYSKDCNVRVNITARENIKQDSPIAQTLIASCACLIAAVLARYYSQSLTFRENPAIFLPTNVYQTVVPIFLQNIDIFAQPLELCCMIAILLTMYKQEEPQWRQSVLCCSMLGAAAFAQEYYRLIQLYTALDAVYAYKTKQQIRVLWVFVMIYVATLTSIQTLNSNAPERCVILIMVCNMLAWLWRTAKLIFHSRTRIWHRGAVATTLLYDIAHQMMSVTVLVEVCSPMNEHMVDCPSVWLLVYLITSGLMCVFSITTVFTRFLRLEYLNRHRKIQLDIETERMTYEFARMFCVEKQTPQTGVAIPFSFPRRLHYDCINPGHHHSNSQHWIHFGILTEDGPKETAWLEAPPESACFLLGDTKKLSQAMCPICFENLRLLEEHPELFQTNLRPTEAPESFEPRPDVPNVILLEALSKRNARGQPIASTRCGHAFHWDCLKQWVENSRTCPACRASLVK